MDMRHSLASLAPNNGSTGHENSTIRARSTGRSRSGNGTQAHNIRLCSTYNTRQSSPDRNLKELKEQESQDLANKHQRTEWKEG